MGAQKCHLTARDGGNAGTAGAFSGPGISRSRETLPAASLPASAFMADNTDKQRRRPKEGKAICSADLLLRRVGVAGPLPDLHEHPKYRTFVKFPFLRLRALAFPAQPSTIYPIAVRLTAGLFQRPSGNQLIF
ncbi:hypothetical protein UN63_03310 [Oceanisphaera arctica]|uniref:Uncharacterized protein n=1 Tax=Oceanisphaera arctica TaxID=641510 RepID=A0A2P5TQ77_9GAMM|nr:hypothetical protein UN63_03310 [Oceanisphaera arctica]GHA23861.1 hypothetical protein GCM10007082_25730 [Oceanisphaera arctica]